MSRNYKQANLITMMPYDKLEKGKFLNHRVRQVSTTWNFFTVLLCFDSIVRMIIFFGFSNNINTSKSKILSTIVTLVAMIILLLIAKRYPRVVHLFGVLTMVGYFKTDLFDP